MPSVWGENLGQGGIDLVPEEGSISTADIIEQRQQSAISGIRPILNDSDRLSGMERLPEHAGVNQKTTADEREMGNIELSSPIRLSRQAKEIIAKLRRMKDEAEDWVK